MAIEKCVQLINSNVGCASSVSVVHTSWITVHQDSGIISRHFQYIKINQILQGRSHSPSLHQECWCVHSVTYSLALFRLSIKWKWKTDIKILMRALENLGGH